MTTLTSRIFLFVETEHEIFKNYIKVENGIYKWSEKLTNELQIISITNTEKVEVYDNSEDGFEGFICFIITEESELACAYVASGPTSSAWK